jgi:PKD repeat protein
MGAGERTGAVVLALIVLGSSFAGATLLSQHDAAHPLAHRGGFDRPMSTDPAANPASAPRTGSPSASQAPKWTEISSGSSGSPPPRESAGMVYDSTDGYLILFGGEQTNPGPPQYYNDTWKFAHGQWTNITTPHSPAARFGFLLADDPADGAVVLFGGIGAAKTDCNNTWEFKAGTWTNVTAGGGPTGRFWGSMSYDTATSQVLLFGGNQNLNPSYSNDTWAFHARTWTRLSPTTQPPARDDENQVDDVADHEVVMFGGLNTIDYVNDTWTYSGGNWAPVTGGTVPDARGGAGMAYDAAAQSVIMYGGYPANSYYYSTWVFHAGAWTQYALTPTPGAGTIWGQMAYDAADGYVVLFEGDGAANSTWALNFSGTGPAPLSVTASALPLSGPAPLPVTFSALASGGMPPYSYLWKFGDQATSSTENLTHTYTTAATYTANLTVTDHAAGTVGESFTIVVQTAQGTPAPLELSIAATPLNASVNQTVTFTSTPSGGNPPYSYSWNFADHSTASTQNPTHSYAMAGSYRVMLTLTDSKGASVQRNVTVSVGNAAQSPAASSSNDLTYWIVIVVVVIAALLIVALLWRRRKAPKGVPSPATGPPAASPVPPHPPVDPPSSDPSMTK